MFSSAWLMIWNRSVQSHAEKDIGVERKYDESEGDIRISLRISTFESEYVAAVSFAGLQIYCTFWSVHISMVMG